MRLAILGAGGHGKVIADLALALDYEEIVFFDDAWPETSSAGQWPIAGTTAMLMDSISEFDASVVGIGDNKVRHEKYAGLQVAGAPIATLIHPTAHLTSSARIGVGSIVCAGATVNVDSVLGCGVIVNTGAIVDHECRISDFVHIAPGAVLSGGVQVGTHSLIGVGGCVKRGISIGDDVIVGAGAVVVSDIVEGMIVVGNPARELKG